MTATATMPVLAPDAQGVRRLEFNALGTNCLIKFRLADERSALEFAASALDWIGKFEAKFSRFRPDSLVSRINAAAGREWVKTDSEMEALLDIAAEIHACTDGIIDPTLLPLLKVWNWAVRGIRWFFLQAMERSSLPRKNKTRMRRAANVRSPLAFAMIRATSEFIPSEAALVIRCFR